jgi:hypothetical protein
MIQNALRRSRTQARPSVLGQSRDSISEEIESFPAFIATMTEVIDPFSDGDCSTIEEMSRYLKKPNILPMASSRRSLEPICLSTSLTLRDAKPRLLDLGIFGGVSFLGESSRPS